MSVFSNLYAGSHFVCHQNLSHFVAKYEVRHFFCESKHLKGRLGPSVGDGHVFGSMEVGWEGPRVGDGHVFASMEVSSPNFALCRS